MINVEIDALTNSIQNRITGDVFETEILELTTYELDSVKDWQFNWLKESRYFKIYKLITVADPAVIQGLMSMEKRGGYVYMSLLENAPSNIGKEQIYAGVAGNLVAYACKYSFDCKFEGFVNFVSKSQLVEHYQKTLGAKIIFARNMIIEKDAATKLVNQYFKNYFE
jgi:hypothetical protein